MRRRTASVSDAVHGAWLLGVTAAAVLALGLAIDRHGPAALAAVHATLGLVGLAGLAGLALRQPVAPARRAISSG